MHEFFEVREHPDTYRTGSMETQFKFPEKLYSQYMAAELHTRKVRVPLRMKMLVLAPVVLMGIGVYVYNDFSARYVDKPRIFASVESRVCKTAARVANGLQIGPIETHRRC